MYKSKLCSKRFDYNSNNFIENKIYLIENDYTNILKFEKILINYKNILINLSDTLNQYKQNILLFYPKESFHNELINNFCNNYNYCIDMYKKQINNIESVSKNVNLFIKKYNIFEPIFEGYNLERKKFIHYSQKLKRLNDEKSSKLNLGQKLSNSFEKRIERNIKKYNNARNNFKVYIAKVSQESYKIKDDIFNTINNSIGKIYHYQLGIYTNMANRLNSIADYKQNLEQRDIKLVKYLVPELDDIDDYLDKIGNNEIVNIVLDKNVLTNNYEIDNKKLNNIDNNVNNNNLDVNKNNNNLPNKLTETKINKINNNELISNNNNNNNNEVSYNNKSFPNDVMINNNNISNIINSNTDLYPNLNNNELIFNNNKIDQLNINSNINTNNNELVSDNNNDYSIFFNQNTKEENINNNTFNFSNYFNPEIANKANNENSLKTENFDIFSNFEHKTDNKNIETENNVDDKYKHLDFLI